MKISRIPDAALHILVIVFLASVSARADDVLSSGPWSVRAGAEGPVETRYRDKILFRGGKLISFEPGWHEQRFTMASAQSVIQSDSGTWNKEDQGNQSALIALDLTPQSCSLVVCTTANKPGPTQFSIEIAPEAVKTQEDRCVIWIDGSILFLDLEEPFDRIPGIQEMRFEQASRSVSIRCNSFELQDRRQNGAGLCLIKVMDAGAEVPQVFSTSLEVAVQEFGDDLSLARKEMLSQTIETVHPVPLNNPGFESESDFSGWDVGSLATIDQSAFHEGTQSARLCVSATDVSSESLYLVQRVPIQEGHFYQAEAWIRTENVQSAAVAGMPSAGAAVIIEFADHDGKWFASGSYSPGIFGTSEWVLAQTGRVRAPEGSGFAILFLGLRGLGTAWFDDVTLSQLDGSVFLREPLPGSSLNDNTPAFDWLMEKRTWSTLELSQDPTFPPGKCVTVAKVELSPFSLDEPIDAGTWFWRVAVPEKGLVSPVWSFEQIAPLDADTTPPQIEAEHQWLQETREAFEFQVCDDSSLKEVFLEIDSHPVPIVHRESGSLFRYAPTVDWKDGLHEARIVVVDAEGNRAEKRVFLTHSDTVPETRWKVAGGVQIGSENFYPLAMYGVRIEDMTEIAAAGFNLVHNYQWDGTGTNSEALEYLNAAERHGLKAFIGFQRKHLMAGNEKFVAERVGALMGHPALLAWYLYDEPDIPSQYVSAMWLGRYYRLIKALDPKRPVIMTCAFDDAALEYRAAYDVHWAQVYNGTKHVAERLALQRSLLGDQTPLLGILICYDRIQSAFLRQGNPVDPDQFELSSKRMRADAFIALARGSSGLAWWWWGQGSPNYFTVADAPAAWEHLKKVVSDIRSLTPLLCAPGPVHSWEQPDSHGNSLLVWSKHLRGRCLLIAANPTESTLEVSISMGEIVSDGIVEVLFENQTTEVRDGLLHEQFTPQQVHVYERTDCLLSRNVRNPSESSPLPSIGERSLYCPAATTGAGGSLLKFWTAGALNERISHFSELPDLLTEARRFGSNVVYLVDWWAGGYANKGDYDINPELGGPEAFRKGIEDLHAQGGKIVLYLEPFIIHRTSSRIGQTQGTDWAMTGSDGAYYPYYGDASFYLMYPGIGSGWTDYFATLCVNLARDYAIDGVFLDSYGIQWDWRDYNPQHPDADSGSGFNAGVIALLGQVRDRMHAHVPHATIWVEGSEQTPVLDAVDGSFIESLEVYLDKPWWDDHRYNVFIAEYDLRAMQTVLARGASLACNDFYFADIPSDRDFDRIRNGVKHKGGRELQQQVWKMFNIAHANDLELPADYVTPEEIDRLIETEQYHGKSTPKPLPAVVAAVDYLQPRLVALRNHPHLLPADIIHGWLKDAAAKAHKPAKPTR